ncbi:MAG: hypothetical protein AB1762_07170, partial [Gemmatimonadota bacterium]
MALLRDAWTFTRFLTGLPAFLAKRMTYAEATALVRQRLENRERNFLESLDATVFGQPRSPYRALLDAARCTRADVIAMVQRDGIETTLRALREAGVYVTFEEFKGRQPVVRNGREIPISARA